MVRIKNCLICLVAITAFSCKESYRPDVISSPDSFLVVEGVLIVGGPATIKLSRTSKLDTTGFRNELNAQVTVEGKDNTTRTLANAGNGLYTSPDLNLILNNEYRLRIRTTGGREYLSEYVTAVQTPAIDSIGWKLNDEGLQIYVSSHDASGNTRYYRWDYEETWEIRSYHYSRQIYNSTTNTVRDRTPAEMVHTGWKYDKSTSIMLGSSARLQDDIIFEAPINLINNGHEKLSVRYSILLRQYALDKEGFGFYELMKRNTENLGTIFDPQPSEIKGNIRNVSDPAEPVIGHISASTVEEKRVFISNIPHWRFIEYCPAVTVPNNPDSLKAFFGTYYLSPVEAINAPGGGFIIEYVSSYPECVDVTVRGASVIKPSYW